MDSQPSTAPRSWAEDLNTYRSTRGTRSFATVQQADVPKRMARTNLIPLADDKHPRLPYGDHPTGAVSDPGVLQARYSRHGWGNCDLLKEEGVSTPSTSYMDHAGRRPVQPQPAKDGRNGLFGTLQGTEAGCVDVWIGNALIDPTKGKRPANAPQDPKGRKDLFDVLHARNPGMPSDDSWLGHKLIDPAKGKAKPLAPDELRGRTGLTTVIQQAPLSEREQALGGGDSWLGHRLIDPSKGKKAVEENEMEVSLLGGVVRETLPPRIVAADAKYNRPHKVMVEPSVKTTVSEHLSHTLPAVPPDFGPRFRRAVSTPRRGDNIYSMMTYKPMAEVEFKKVYKNSWDDGDTVSRTRRVPPLTAPDPSSGKDMLQWKPSEKIASYVPYNGLMREQRQATAVQIKT